MLSSIIKVYKEAYSNHSRGVWVLSVCMFISRCGRMVVIFLSLYLTESLSYTEKQAGQIISLYGLGGVIGSYITGRLVNTYSAVGVQVVMMIISVPICVLVPFCTSSWSLACSVLLLSLFCEGIRPANATAVAKMSPPGKQARSFSLQRTFMNCGMSLGPAIGGVLATYSFTLVFVVDALGTLITALWMWYMLGLDKIVSPKSEAHETAAADKSKAVKNRKSIEGCETSDRQLHTTSLGTVSSHTDDSNQSGKNLEDIQVGLEQRDTEYKQEPDSEGNLGHLEGTRVSQAVATRTIDDVSQADILPPTAGVSESEHIERVHLSTEADQIVDRKPMSDPIFVTFLVLNFITFLGFFQLASTLPLYTRDMYGFSKSKTGLLFSMNTVLVILFEMVLTTWSQTLDPMLTIGAGSFLVLWGFGCFAFIHHPFIIYVGLALTTVGQMLSTPIASGFVADRSVGKHQGEYMGIRAISDAAAFIVAPSVGTYIYAIDREALWYCCLGAGVVVLLGFVRLSVVLRRGSQKNHADLSETTPLLT